MKKILSIFPIICICISGCTNDELSSDADSISLSAETITFGQEGGTEEVEIQSSGDWTVSGYSDWVKPLSEEGKSGDKLVFEALPNKTSQSKEAIFKVFTGNATAKITVKSEVETYIELLSPEENSIGAGENILEVEVKTNVSELEFEYSGNGAEWISMSTITDVFGIKKIRFNVSENTVYTKRESAIIVKGKDSNVQTEVRISQAMPNAVITETPKIVTSLDGGTIELAIRSNVDYQITSELPEWIGMTLKSEGEIEEDGLATDVYTITYGSSETSRLTEINCTYNGVTLLSIFFKQQAENAILTTISDPVLRKYLSDKGWVLCAESNDECEILEPGISATSLDIVEGGSEQIMIKSISGLGGFPNLSGINLRLTFLERLDLSDCNGISAITIKGCSRIAYINTGDNPITNLTVNEKYNDIMLAPSLEVLGKNIETLSVEADGQNVQMDKIESLDVSECTNLKTLNAKRDFYNFIFSLKTIYVSSAQQASIDAGDLSVTKTQGANIVVKE